jgi:hypothetical protein
VAQGIDPEFKPQYHENIYILITSEVRILTYEFGGDRHIAPRSLVIVSYEACLLPAGLCPCPRVIFQMHEVGQCV